MEGIDVGPTWSLVMSVTILNFVGLTFTKMQLEENSIA